MAIRIAINGFGRIGRLVFRVASARPDLFEIVGINDLTDAPTLAHLLKYDSVHGRFNGEVKADQSSILVNGVSIAISAEKQIENIPWNNLDCIIESTGVFSSKDQLSKHLAHGRKVVLTSPAKDALDKTIESLVT